MGDYNIDLLKSNVHSPTSDFLEMMYDKSFYNLISRPTRITNATATFIDNIYTNSVSFDKDKFSGVLTSDISDHFMVFCMFQISDTKNNDDDDFYLIRRYSEKNKNTFVHNLNAIDWNEVLPNSNAQLAFSTFHSLIKKEYDTNFPLIKVKRQYNNKKPWLTNCLRKSIRQKNKLYIKAKAHPTLNNEITYKRYKNKLLKILKQAEK